MPSRICGTRIVDQRKKRRDIFRRPVPRHELFARRRRIRRRADQLDDLIDIGNRSCKADEHMGPVTRLREQELRPPRNDGFAELRESLDEVEQVVLLWPSAIERDHIGGERRIAVS